MSKQQRLGDVLRHSIIFVVLVLLAYLLLWPVTIEPRAWNAPRDRGYVGAFTPNQRLQEVERHVLPNSVGPEDIAIDAQGRPVFGVLSGDILRLEADGSFTTLTTTGGRPLGLEFDDDGGLWIADAYQGLMHWSLEKGLELLVTEVDGVAVRYADDVDIAADGTVYFSDASMKFPAASVGTYEASLLDIMEHSGNGRVLAYQPKTGRTYTVQGGLHFANGVAVSHDQQWLLVVETGSYRILKIGIGAHNNGEVVTLIKNLPGFPDNINDGPNGKFWVGLVSPRSEVLDSLSNHPYVRKMIQRLPSFIRPQAKNYGHVIAIDSRGNVVENLQDPAGSYAQVTGAAEVAGRIYLSSLHENAIAVMALKQAD